MKVINTLGTRVSESSTKGNTVVARKHSMDGSKSTRRKVGYVALFTHTTRRGALSEEASILSVEMTAMKDKRKEGHKMGNIYRLVELNAGH